MGLIRVNSHDAWPCSARIFDLVLEEIRTRVPDERTALAAEVRTAAGAHLHWWCLTDLAKEDYRFVLRAVQHLAGARPSGASFSAPAEPAEPPGLAARLAELVRLLLLDRRATEGDSST